MSDPIRIAVVDDHMVVRKGIIAMLETEPDLQVVGEGSNGREAVELAVSLHPDVILMDLVMPEMDGIEATRQIKQRAPEVHVLVLTSFSSNDKVLPSLNAGAIGYLLKDSNTTDLVRAIHQVARGEGSLHPLVTRQLLKQLTSSSDSSAPVEELTEREAEVLKYIARGLSNHEIAEELVVSNATVNTHVSKILAKLNLTSRTQAALYALRKGLVSLDDTEIQK
ncbi:response regulator transcription factor [bacterium]|nr:MAG: response regulator transcription factor [bacterium]